MRGRLILSIFFILIVVSLLVFYWFVPFGKIEFSAKPVNSNFSVGNSGDMQFYENMRYPDSKISYHIYNCSLQKQNDMEYAFSIISNLTVLNFYSADSGEEISVFCDEKNKFEGQLFIAGEGGPTIKTQSGKFNVILSGKILLIKDSSCPKPNIAIHELLHAMGFEHSANSENIMYPVSECEQTIGQDVVNLLNQLYTIPSYPDLTFENVSAIMKGKYLDTDVIIRNNGLVNSENSKLMIYSDDKLLKEVELNPIQIGYGTIIKLTNVWIMKINVDELKFFINYTSEELDKENNNLVLSISA